MTYAADIRHFTPPAADAASPYSGAATNKPSLLRRVYDAIIEARQRQADQDIARWLVQSGWRLTDNTERESIYRTLLASNCRRRGQWAATGLKQRPMILRTPHRAAHGG